MVPRQKDSINLIRGTENAVYFIRIVPKCNLVTVCMLLEPLGTFLSALYLE